jgi:hypothetical protein
MQHTAEIIVEAIAAASVKEIDSRPIPMVNDFVGEHDQTAETIVLRYGA